VLYAAVSVLEGAACLLWENNTKIFLALRLPEKSVEVNYGNQARRDSSRARWGENTDAVVSLAP